ncbi:hypothetical protein G3A43_08835 [Paraburkholderia aspalathi]|nr:hypothetical protein [Paraburkholderia aspalathi]MBK3780363.1 hypothetical protein [Paraburkholderia aspalathi]
MAIHSAFGKAAGRVFRLDDISSADFSRIEQLEATVTMRNGHVFEVRDIDALELAYAIKPTAVEGRRLRYARCAWMVHNLVGHPLMQLLALFKLYRCAFWVHDATAPRARGTRHPRSS